LADFGNTPIVIPLENLLSENYFNFHKNKVNEDRYKLIAKIQHLQGAFYLPKNKKQIIKKN
jgi:hypothetical protein